TEARPFLEEGIRRQRERLADLLAEASTAPVLGDPRFGQVVQELTTGVEELLVAEEELRRQAEELAASRNVIDAERERYAELFAPDAYLATDEQGEIAEANDQASAMLGVPPQFLVGKLLVGFVDESARRTFRTILRTLREAPAEVEEQYVRLHPRDGVPFIAAVRAASRQDGRDGSTVVRWMARDISERVAMQEEIRVLHAEVDLLASLGQVARLTDEPQSVDAVLTRVADLATRALPDCEVSVAATGAGAVSGDRAARLDEVAGAHDAGPGQEARAAGSPIRATLADCAERWPELGAAAAEAGLVSVSCYPFDEPSGQGGAVTVYAFAELTPHALELVPLLVDNVAIALANGVLYESAHSLATHLQRALESRGVIEQAKGVLIGRQGCSDEEAFDILRRASQRMNRKLRDVAADLVAHVRTGDGPAPAPAPPSPAPAPERPDSPRRAGDRPATTEGLAALHERARELHERAVALQQMHPGVGVGSGNNPPAPAGDG
ncbi:MAG: ANTAR domain-containing protein, partial [Acidimicrobiales bacterium]